MCRNQKEDWVDSNMVEHGKKMDKRQIMLRVKVC